MVWQRVQGLLKSLAVLRVPGWIRTIIGVLILAVVVCFFARRAGQTMDMVREAWQPVSWLYLISSYLLLLVCFFMMALMWYGVLRTMGGRLSLSAALRFYGITLLPRYIPGMIWGYAGRTVLCEKEGVARTIAAGSAVAEIALIVATGLSIALMKPFGPSWLGVVIMPPLILLLGSLATRLQSWRHGTSLVRQAAKWYGLALAYLAFWSLYGSSSWLVAMSVAPEAARSHPLEIILSSVIAWLAGFLAVFVPSGLGVREGVFSLTLTPIMGPAAGMFIPLLARLIGMLAEVTFFLICLLLFRNHRSTGVTGGQQAPSG